MLVSLTSPTNVSVLAEHSRQVSMSLHLLMVGTTICKRTRTLTHATRHAASCAYSPSNQLSGSCLVLPLSSDIAKGMAYLLQSLPLLPDVALAAHKQKRDLHLHSLQLRHPYLADAFQRLRPACMECPAAF